MAKGKKTSRARAKKKAPAVKKTRKKGHRTKTTRVGNGVGWGGAAKGASTPIPPHDFEGKPGPGRSHFSREGEERAERRARHAEEMEQILYDVAHNGEKDETRVSAANHLLNRIEGLPVAKVLSMKDPISSLTDSELEEELDRQRRCVEKFEKNTSTKDMPAETA